jgi:hypothetical protein
MSLELQVKLVESRANRFKELKEAYDRGEDIQKGFEWNDIAALNLGLYSKLYRGIEIPSELVEEARSLLNIKLRNSKFYAQCETVERRLHQILSDYKNKHPQTQN